MRNLILGLALILGSQTFAQRGADGPGGTPPDRSKINKEIAQALDLEKDKESNFLNISEKYDEKFEKLMKSKSNNKNDFEKMKALESEKDDEMKSILSEEEYQKYLNIINEMRPPKPPKRN